MMGATHEYIRRLNGRYGVASRAHAITYTVVSNTNEHKHIHTQAVGHAHAQIVTTPKIKPQNERCAGITRGGGVKVNNRKNRRGRGGVKKGAKLTKRT